MEDSEGNPPEEALKQLRENTEALQLACDFFLDVILYRRPSKAEMEVSPTIFIPPGLSSRGAERLIKKHTEIPSTELLIKWKLGIIKLLSMNLLPQTLVYPLLICSSSDIFHEVVFKSEGAEKRLGKINYENVEIVNVLLNLYLGDSANHLLNAIDKRSSVNESIKFRLLNVLSKSVTSCNCLPNTIKVIFDAIFSPNSSSKVRLSGLQYTIWVVNAAKLEVLQVLGPILLPSILKLLSLPKSEEVEEVIEIDPSKPNVVKPFYPTTKHREATYTLLSSLSTKVPQLFSNDLSIVKFLFQSLTNEEATVKLTVQQVLAVVALAYIHSTLDIKESLSNILLDHLNSEDVKVRRCSVEWSCSVFPFDYIPSRFLCIALCGDVMPEVREVALRGLTANVSNGKKKLKSQTTSSSVIYPDAIKLLTYIYDNDISTIKEKKSSEEIKESNAEGRINLFNLSDLAIKGLLSFINECLMNKYQEDLSTYRTFNNYMLEILKDGNSQRALDFYCKIINDAFERRSVSSEAILMHEAASISLLSLMESQPQYFSQLYCSKLEWFLPQLRNASLVLRENVASVIPLVLEQMSSSSSSSSSSFTSNTERVKSFLNLLQSGLEEREGLAIGLDGMHGYILCLGNSLQKCQKVLPSNIVQYLINDVFMKLFDHRLVVIKGVAAEAIGNIGISQPLDLSSEIKLLLVTRLHSLILLKEHKLLEKVVIACGNLCHGEVDKEISIKLLESIFSLSENTNEEVQLATGESLANAASSPLLTEYIYHKIMNEFYISPKPFVRRSVAIWLLALVKFTHKSPFIQSNIPSIQVAFTSMLNDKNDLVQECAGKGLALLYDVYENDDRLKKDLLHSLVSTLTSGIRQINNSSLVNPTSDNIFAGNEVAASISNASGVIDNFLLSHFSFDSFFFNVFSSLSF